MHTLFYFSLSIVGYVKMSGSTVHNVVRSVVRVVMDQCTQQHCTVSESLVAFMVRWHNSSENPMHTSPSCNVNNSLTICSQLGFIR